MMNDQNRQPESGSTFGECKIEVPWKTIKEFDQNISMLPTEIKSILGLPSSPTKPSQQKKNEFALKYPSPELIDYYKIRIQSAIDNFIKKYVPVSSAQIDTATITGIIDSLWNSEKPETLSTPLKQEVELLQHSFACDREKLEFQKKMRKFLDEFKIFNDGLPRTRNISGERETATKLEKEFQELFGVPLGIIDSLDAFMNREVPPPEELYYHILPFEIISSQMRELVYDLCFFEVSLPLTDTDAEKYGVSKDQTFGNTYSKYASIKTAFATKKDLLKTLRALEVNTFTARPFLRRVDYAQLWIAGLRSRPGTHEAAQDINHWASLQKDGELIFVETSDNDEKELIQRSASKRAVKLIESFQDCLKVLDRKKSEKEPVETIAHAQNILKNILSLIQV